MNKENKKKPKKRDSFKHVSLKDKREAIKMLYSRQLTVEEISKLYKVSKPTILQRWTEQVKRENDRFPGHKRLPIKLKIKVVREVLSGSLTIEDVMHQYDILTRETVEKWIAKYSGQIAYENNASRYMRNNKSSSDFSQEQYEENKKLEKALEEANLKVLALETMISIAEDHFKINIRKKSGTKQSE